MNEKKRYEFNRDSSSPIPYILDTLTGEKTSNFPHIANLLNQQDKRIKDLENMNSRLSQGIYWGNGEHFCDVVSRLKQENQQLKEENGYIIFSDGFDENGNRVCKQEFVKYKDKFHELVEEIKQLKQSNVTTKLKRSKE